MLGGLGMEKLNLDLRINNHLGSVDVVQENRSYASMSKIVGFFPIGFCLYMYFNLATEVCVNCEIDQFFVVNSAYNLP